MKRAGFVAIACIVMLVCTQASAQGQKVLFFEAAVAPTDMTFSKEPSGYSKLADMLKDAGMLSASMSSGEITRQKLSPYEIVVLHPSPERPLGKREISAVVWFVAQQGGALFIHGGAARIVNPLTEIFGISMDTSTLADASSAMDESVAGDKFVLSRFPSGSGFTFDGIKSIGFHGGAPLVLSEDAAAVVTGDEDCYSNNGLYSIGSFPPVAAVAYLGRGVILVKSDRTMLNNANIENYDNIAWAKTVFERLASTQETEWERERSLLGLRSRVSKLEEMAKACGEQRNKYETDLMTSYKKTKALQKELRDSETKNKELMEQLSTLEDEKKKQSERLATYQNPDTLKMVALGAAAVLLVVFLCGLVVGRRTMRGRI